jgi:hypothetical protein
VNVTALFTAFVSKVMIDVMETNHPDNKNAQYHQLVERDLLLNKLQNNQAEV